MLILLPTSQAWLALIAWPHHDFSEVHNPLKNLIKIRYHSLCNLYFCLWFPLTIILLFRTIFIQIWLWYNNKYPLFWVDMFMCNFLHVSHQQQSIRRQCWQWLQQTTYMYIYMQEQCETKRSKHYSIFLNLILRPINLVLFISCFVFSFWQVVWVLVWFLSLEDKIYEMFQKVRNYDYSCFNTT